jgi:hypothetical protein
LNERLGLSVDGLQWILNRSSLNKATGELNWTPIAFVSSSRDILLRCIMESGLDDGTAASATASLPTFAAFQAARNSSQRSRAPTLEEMTR